MGQSAYPSVQHDQIAAMQHGVDLLCKVRTNEICFRNLLGSRGIEHIRSRKFLGELLLLSAPKAWDFCQLLDVRRRLQGHGASGQSADTPSARARQSGEDRSALPASRSASLVRGWSSDWRA